MTSLDTGAATVALAKKTPLTRGAVTELAKRIAAADAAKLAAGQLDAIGAPAALVLAFVAAAGGHKLAASLVRALLPEVLSLDQVGPLVFATEGEPLDVLVQFLEDKRGDLELECLVLLLAAEEIATRELAVPPALLVRGRWLARHKLEADASIFLGGAALRLRDRDLTSLSTPHVNRAKRARREIQDTLAAAREAPLAVLPDALGARISSGFTVKHETPSVGRNDPCPCGSGKKYKKCHALEGSPESAAANDEPALDPTLLGPDQAALLRPSEIAALPTNRLSPKAFVEAFRRVVDFRQWPLARRMIDEASDRKDLTADVPALTLDALHGTYEARAPEAPDFFALLPEKHREREAFALTVLSEPPDLLARIEKEAEAALRTEADGARAMMLAAALLRWFPALGIFVARGALHEGRAADSVALLETIEDARDRLLLSPFELWWDVYEAFFEGPPEEREQQKDEAKREKMKADLKRARAASRKTAAELEKLQARVAELDESLAGPASKSKVAPIGSATPALAPPDVAEERRRLKTKIDELQRIIGEGQEERRELRQKLAEREEDEAPAPPTKPTPGKAGTRSDPDAEPEGLHDAEAVDAPRAILVPRYADRAGKVLVDLAGDAAEGVLSTVTSLAAGKPNTWGSVKQLTKARGILSARAGIHHRVLFTVEDGVLEVLEVIHRRDLELAVTRLARA